jgi:hypothetical protein
LAEKRTVVDHFDDFIRDTAYIVRLPELYAALAENIYPEIG